MSSKVYKFHWCPLNEFIDFIDVHQTNYRNKKTILLYHFNCCCSFGHLKIVTVSSFWHGFSVWFFHSFELTHAEIVAHRQTWIEIICYVNFIAGEYLSKEKNKSLFSSVYPLFYRIYRSNSIFDVLNSSWIEKKKKKTNQSTKFTFYFLSCEILFLQMDIDSKIELSSSRSHREKKELLKHQFILI